jgi:CDGSH-type Zn-finger protein
MEVKATKNGPYLIPGNVIFKDAQGNEKPIERMVALCRCGHSANKPFCDGTHKKINFEADEATIILNVLS